MSVAARAPIIGNNTVRKHDMLTGISVALALFSSALAIIVRDPPTEYKYSYDIRDPVTGDTKSQHEVKNGDVVSGSYSVLDPDGTRRTVKYSADPERGFQATVVSEPVMYNAPKEEDNNIQTNYYRYTSAVAGNAPPPPKPVIDAVAYLPKGYVKKPVIQYIIAGRNPGVDLMSNRYYVPKLQHY